MTPRETFQAAVRKALRSQFRLDETVDLILAAGDEYAESDHRRRLSVAYARLLDVPVMDGPKRSDERELA